jgi:hypothetical protein
MYFPKSQITPNLYTNGDEFVYTANSRPYTGYYFKTSTGKFYTGRNQDDRPNELLSRITNQANEIDNNRPLQSTPRTSIALPFEGVFPVDADVADNAITPNYNEDLVINYLNLQKISLNNLPSSIIPTYSPAIPTSQDYQNGEFQRYFCKKVNELTYIEINLDQFTKLKTKSPEIEYSLFIPFTITWVLTGNKEQVAKTNKNIVELAIFKQKLPRFGEYIRFDYLKYYNQSGSTNVLADRNSRTNSIFNDASPSGSIHRDNSLSQFYPSGSQ